MSADDVTDRALREADLGPGPYCALVRRARAAHVADLSVIPEDPTLGAWSTVLAYGVPHRRGTKADHSRLIRQLRGGHVRLIRHAGPPPAGSRAANETPHATFYYTLSPADPSRAHQSTP